VNILLCYEIFREIQHIYSLPRILHLISIHIQTTIQITGCSYSSVKLIVGGNICIGIYSISILLEIYENS